MRAIGAFQYPSMCLTIYFCIILESLPVNVYEKWLRLDYMQVEDGKSAKSTWDSRVDLFSLHSCRHNEVWLPAVLRNSGAVLRNNPYSDHSTRMKQVQSLSVYEWKLQNNHAHGRTNQCCKNPAPYISFTLCYCTQVPYCVWTTLEQYSFLMWRGSHVRSP